MSNYHLNTIPLFLYAILTFSTIKTIFSGIAVLRPLLDQNSGIVVTLTAQALWSAYLA